MTPKSGNHGSRNETRLYAQSYGTLVLTGRAVPAAATVPYRPLTEALLQSLRTRDVSDDPALARWLPMLEAVVPMGVGAGEHLSAGPSPVRAEAVLRLLRLIAGSSGLLVVLEDLHWSDPDTLAVVEYLADNLPAETVLCIATVRTERTDTPSEALLLAERLHARRGATMITLDRLTDRQVDDMVRACLPGCGSGLALQLAAKRGVKVSGLDASSELLQVTRERVPDGTIEQGDLEEIPLPDNSFDAATAFNSGHPRGHRRPAAPRHRRGRPDPLPSAGRGASRT